jgi:hypothetical protein
MYVIASFSASTHFLFPPVDVNAFAFVNASLGSGPGGRLVFQLNEADGHNSFSITRN